MRMIDRQELLLQQPTIMGYRLATNEDIVPNARLYMACVQLGGQAECLQEITLDEEPARDTKLGPYVFYKCDGFPNDCFVPRSYFVNRAIEVEMSGPYETVLYLAKVT